MSSEFYSAIVGQKRMQSPNRGERQLDGGDFESAWTRLQQLPVSDTATQLLLARTDLAASDYASARRRLDVLDEVTLTPRRRFEANILNSQVVAEISSHRSREYLQRGLVIAEREGFFRSSGFRKSSDQACDQNRGWYYGLELFVESCHAPLGSCL